MATAVLRMLLLMATALALGVSPTPAAATECELVPLHTVLAAPGGVPILRDGRELKAETHSVGGCETLSYDPTGARNMYDYTLMSHTSRRCVTATGDDGRAPTYAGLPGDYGGGQRVPLCHPLPDGGHGRDAGVPQDDGLARRRGWPRREAAAVAGARRARRRAGLCDAAGVARGGRLPGGRGAPR